MDMAILKSAVDTLNGVGAGGNIVALHKCVAAYAVGYTPGQILDAARKSNGKTPKNLASHEGVAYGALIVSTLGDAVTPEDAYKYAARIGRLSVLAILGNEDTEDKATALQEAWTLKVQEAAIKKQERDAEKQTASAFLLSVREQVDSLLALSDKGVSLSDEEAQVAASLMDDLRVLVGIQVGANA